MGMFDMFKTAPVQPAPANPAQQPVNQAPAPAPATPGNIPDQPTSVTQATPGTEANGVVPANPAAQTQKDDSPLAQFSGLWEDKPIDPNSPAEPAAHKPLDAAQLQQVMAKVDFSSAVTPETLTAISAGGEPAAAAFMQAMSAVTQQAMVQSTLINEKMTAQAVERAITATEAKIPGLVREQSAAAHIQDANPAFSNPAIKPVIDATRIKLMEKNPTFTPAQINAQLTDFLTAMSETFNPAPVADPLNGGQDWNKFLGGQ